MSTSSSWSRASLVVALAATLGAASVSSRAAAQTMEEKFQDVFVTAGYCTAFGAALGVAVVALHEDPTNNLRYIAMGASLGFIGGSVLGSYVVFSPGFVDARQSPLDVASAPIPERGVMLRPTYDVTQHKVTGVESGMTLARF
jgi:hypothetical protein